jgi:hypothetical protein
MPDHPQTEELTTPALVRELVRIKQADVLVVRPTVEQHARLRVICDELRKRGVLD